MASINLYPPIIDTYMPAYLNPITNQCQKCRIYFALSSLNSADEISYVQLSLINQKTNQSALNPVLYPNGIKMVKFSSVQTAEGLYYIDLYVGNLTQSVNINNKSTQIADILKFETNQYYKVQIRLGSKDLANLTSTTTLTTSAGVYTIINFTSNWLGQSLQYISEWSTVCLIKGLSRPTFTFTSSALNSCNAESATTITIGENIPVIGLFGFEDSTETDYLKSYRVTLMNSNSTILYDDSGLCFTDKFNPNSINYLSKYFTETDKVYVLRIDYVTNNLYSGAFVYKFKRTQRDVLTLNATLQTYFNKDDNQIVIRVNFGSSQKDYSGHLVVKRSSSDTNFQIWENIHKVAMADLKAIAAKGYLWGDFTVQSGKWYKYAIQWIQDSNASNIQYSQNIMTKNPVSMMLEEICIVGDNTQIKIKFNPKISSFNYKTVQSTTETIGSKYPFIRRNGNIGYKTFNISGLITRHMDENEFFASAADVYGNSDMISYYEEYNQENRINAYNDHTYEYLFREKVVNFLNDGQVKLFRSPSEGNLLVILSNVTITPNETLGRLVYNFSANVTEVGEANIENYINYNIVEYKNTEYVLQGIKISEDNGYITVYATTETSGDPDYVMNAGVQVTSGKTILILNTN